MHNIRWFEIGTPWTVSVIPNGIVMHEVSI